MSSGTHREIRQHHVCITGFLQKHGSPETGLAHLWRQLDIEHGSNPHTRVSLKSWNDNWDDFAELIFRFRNGNDPDIRVAAYSWGAGYGAMQLANQLQQRGLKIQSMVLADPVYRSRFFSTRWLALMNRLPLMGAFPQIVVPENVQHVICFRQKQSRPAGHRLIARCSRQTKILDRGFLSYDHQHIDDATEFHAAVIEAARQQK